MSLHGDMLIGVIDRCDTDRRSAVVVRVAINIISDFIGVIDRCDMDRRSAVVVRVAINNISDFTK